MSATAWIILATVGLGFAAILLMRRGPLPSALGNVLYRGTRAYTRLWHNLRFGGTEHIPAQGPVVIASNHTTGIDPLLLQSACPRAIRWVMLSSWRFGLLEPVWRAVEPIMLDDDSRDVSQVRQIVRRLDQGEVVGMFPEGGLQREHRELNLFHPGIAMVARRSHAVIVPAFIAGTPRRRHMLWHFLQPSRSRVTFGEPYQPGRDVPRQQILDELRKRIEALKP